MSKVIVVFTIVCLVSCMEVNVKNQSISDSFSIFEEQVFWDSWIKKHDDSTCPLEPLTTILSKEKLNGINSKIQKAIKQSNVFIVSIIVNIDNGIFDISCFLQDNNKWKVLKWANLGETFSEKYISSSQFINDDLLKKVYNKTIFVDTSERMIFDADSVYIMLKYNDDISRFAVYNSEFDEERKKNGGTSIIFIEKIISEMENNSH